MNKETVNNSADARPSPIARLKRARDGLKVKIHLARCGIQQEWEKAEAKWLLLNRIDTPDRTERVAEELKQSYIRIYRGLLAKNRKLLDQLDQIKQDVRPLALQNVKQQITSEMTALRLNLESLGGTESIQSRPEEQPVCPCLKCQQDAGAQPFNVDEILAATRSP